MSKTVREFPLQFVPAQVVHCAIDGVLLDIMQADNPLPKLLVYTESAPLQTGPIEILMVASEALLPEDGAVHVYLGSAVRPGGMVDTPSGPVPVYNSLVHFFRAIVE